ncbi:hypothetical protein JCM11957_11980 [Caminibacter profundus]
MKILINTSNLYVGGGVQVALSLIKSFKEIDRENEYIFILSPILNKLLQAEKFPSNFKIFVIKNSPAQIISRTDIVKKLREIENLVMPDIVFTVFGPSYWRPKSLHVVGFADGWVYNPDSIVYKRINFFNRIKRRMINYYKLYYLKRDADVLVVETNDAKSKLSKFITKPIFVIGNTYHQIFDNKAFYNDENSYFIKLPEKEENEFRLLYIAHPHPNKNIEIINDLIPLIEQKKLNIKFVLTLDKNENLKFFGKNNRYVINVGKVPIYSCPSLYLQVDALFAPTLLETFSAIYPEAMKMKKPILTSNYSFAKDICGDAAFYFDPLNPEDIVNKIIELKENKVLRETLIQKGLKKLKNFETARSRAEKYLQLFSKLKTKRS